MKGLLLKERNNKPFRKGDIVVFILLLILATGCLLPFLMQSTDKPEIIYFTKNGETVLTYDFGTDTFSCVKENVSFEKTEEGYRVTLTEGKERNVFLIDKTERNVIVTETNCSAKKDCLSMTIEEKGDVILCLPHGILVYTDKSDDKIMIIG